MRARRGSMESLIPTWDTYIPCDSLKASVYSGHFMLCCVQFVISSLGGRRGFPYPRSSLEDAIFLFPLIFFVTIMGRVDTAIVMRFSRDL